MPSADDAKADVGIATQHVPCVKRQADLQTCGVKVNCVASLGAALTHSYYYYYSYMGPVH